MPATVSQVNISRGGVPKTPVLHGVVTPLGIDGDKVAHPRFHGGPRQAMLLLDLGSLEEMQRLGHPVFPGALGENITTSGWDRTQVRLGQRYRVGSALVEITKVRVPCKTLDIYGTTIQQQIYDKAVKAGNFTSPRWGLSGFYVAVPEPGEIRPGDIISLAD